MKILNICVIVWLGLLSIVGIILIYAVISSLVPPSPRVFMRLSEGCELKANHDYWIIDSGVYVEMEIKK